MQRVVVMNYCKEHRAERVNRFLYIPTYGLCFMTVDARVTVVAQRLNLCRLLRLVCRSKAVLHVLRLHECAEGICLDASALAK